MRSLGSKLKAAFSLVEVSLALAIVGIAFMALLGILPMGMQTFKSANESAVDARILTVMTTMLQSTEYSKVASVGGITEDVYFFDVDGEFLDSLLKPSVRQDVVKQRIYAAKVISDDQKVPSSTNLTYNRTSVGTRLLIASGKITPAMTDLLKTLSSNPTTWTSDQKKLINRGLIKIRPLILARFEGVKITS
jgi:uncharacterized protein (TIGR02598 family)